MSDIRVKDLSARAALRLGRTYQVNALAPFPVRPPLQLWQPWRRNFVHGAGELGAGFGFGGDSNLLRRLKMGLAAEGVDQPTIDSLTEADVTRDARGVKVKPAALARLPAAIRDKIARPATAPKLQNWFFEKRPALRLARQQATLQADDYEDTGIGDVEQLRILAEGGVTRIGSATIPPPVRLTHIYATINLAVQANNFYAWSVTPPGVGDSDVGDAVNGATPVTDNGTNVTIPCDIWVINTTVLLEGRIFVTAPAAHSNLLVAVSYTRLRRKTIA